MFKEQAVRKLWIMSAHQKEHLSHPDFFLSGKVLTKVEVILGHQRSCHTLTFFFLEKFWEKLRLSWAIRGVGRRAAVFCEFTMRDHCTTDSTSNKIYFSHFAIYLYLLESFVSETLSTWYVWIGKFNFCFDIVGSFKRWKISGWLISGLCQYSGFNVATITETPN